LALRLAIDNPQLADLSCAECQKWVYEIPSGQPQLFEGPDGRKTERIPRAAPPPCDRCPKESPEREHLYVLSDKNYRTLKLHERFRTGVYPLPKYLAGDPLLAENFAIIDEVIERGKRHAVNRDLADLLAVRLATMFRMP